MKWYRGLFFKIVHIIVTQYDDLIESEVLFNEFRKIHFFHLFDLAIEYNKRSFCLIVDVNVGQWGLFGFQEVDTCFGRFRGDERLSEQWCRAVEGDDKSLGVNFVLGGEFEFVFGERWDNELLLFALEVFFEHLYWGGL